MNKLLKTLVSAVLVGVMALSFIGCGNESGSNSAVQAKQGTTFVSLDINPEIEIIVDEDDIVVSIYGANEDGQVLLYGEDDLIGLTLGEVVEKITALAVELGFLTEDNKVVSTIVTSATPEKIEEIKSLVGSKIKGKAENLGLEVETDLEGAFSLVRKLEEYKLENPDNQLIQALTIEKFKLALSVSEALEISLDVAVTLDDKELIEMLTSKRRKIEEFATDAYNRVKAEAMFIYEGAVNSVLDGVYASHYLAHMLDHPSTFWYGHAYNTYKTMARGFGSLANLMKCIEKVETYPIDETMVTEIVAILGLEESEVDKLKDRHGNITIQSIESYIDIFLKNASESEEVEQIKQQITELLNTLDESVMDTVKVEVDKYKPQIEVILGSVERAISSIESTATMIPEQLKAGMVEFIGEIQAIIESVEQDVLNDNISAETLGGYAKVAEEKAAEVLEKIKSDLTEEEIKEIEEKVAQLEKTLEDAKKSMEDAISAMEKDVRDTLSKHKEKRREQHGKNPPRQ